MVRLDMLVVLLGVLAADFEVFFVARGRTCVACAELSTDRSIARRPSEGRRRFLGKEMTSFPVIIESKPTNVQVLLAVSMYLQLKGLKLEW